jgi:Cu+-exporting ATPase
MEPALTTEPNRARRSAVTELSVSGMTCGNCARHVTEAIQSVPGVHSATVSLDSHSASVRWAANGPQDGAALVQAIEKEGYGAKVIEGGQHDSAHHALAGWHTNLVIAILGTAPLLLGEWVFRLGMAGDEISVDNMAWFQWFSFALATVVQIFAGAQFYRGAWNQLKIRSSNMDTLVALGSTTAYGFSVWALFTGYRTHLYFTEAASIITLISVGHWVESRVSVRASDALKKLLNLAPQTARRLTNSGSSRPKEPQILSADFLQSLRAPAAPVEEEVPVANLEIGNLVVLRPGDAVPTDGKVVEGNSAVDEAMLTGESAPIDKSAGNDLFAGTVNLNGRLIMRVTAMGDETALAHIIASVQRAQTSRANIQRLGDRVSGVFVPIVVVIALAAGLWWGLNPQAANHAHQWLGQFLWHAHPPDATAAGFIIAAAVLIIACPCAMGLATPAAIMAGSNAAARRGILIRDGVALEKAGQITAVIFDKTGTLTFGKPEVAAIAASNATGRWETVSPSSAPVALAAALARHSTHPISQAIAKLSGENIEVTDWKEVRGAGVEGNVERRTPNAERRTSRLRLGSLRWLRERGLDAASGESFVNEWSAQGATIVGLADDANWLALFAVKDTVKPGSAKVVEHLSQNRLKTYLVTGDNALTAAGIARQTGIRSENVFAEIRPEDKAEFVKKLQSQGERVAFVGDGINDAPALEQADLGVAVSRASDVAREAADIILLKSDIEAVPEALGLARATLRTIKQNLFWAFFYNCIGIPLAAMGFMSPILCAAAMGFSDLIVIGNALRLRRYGSVERGAQPPRLPFDAPRVEQVGVKGH